MFSPHDMKFVSPTSSTNNSDAAMTIASLTPRYSPNHKGQILHSSSNTPQLLSHQPQATEQQKAYFDTFVIKAPRAPTLLTSCHHQSPITSSAEEATCNHIFIWGLSHTLKTRRSRAAWPRAARYARFVFLYGEAAACQTLSHCAVGWDESMNMPWAQGRQRCLASALMEGSNFINFY